MVSGDSDRVGIIPARVNLVVLYAWNRNASTLFTMLEARVLLVEGGYLNDCAGR